MSIIFVVTSYNNELDIDTCISSLKIIKDLNINIYKILLIDDCSSDNTIKFARKYKCIDYIFCKTKNRGISNSRNIGIKFAIDNNFSNLIFVDADDYLNPIFFYNFNCINYQFHDIIFTNYNILRNKNILLSIFHDEFNPGLIVLTNYIMNYCISPNTHNLISTCWAKIFSVSFLKNNNIKFNENLNICEDTDFMFNCLSHTKNIYFNNNSFYTYTVLTNNKERLTLGTKLTFKETFQFTIIIKNLIKLIKYYRKDISMNYVRVFYINYSVIYSIRSALKINSLENLISYHRVIILHYNSRIMLKSYFYYNYYFLSSFIIKKSIKFKLYFILTAFFYFKSLLRYKLIIN